MECSTVQYTLIENTAKYPSDFYYNWLKLQRNFQQFLEDPKAKDSILKLNLFYDSLDITVIEEVPQFSLDALWG